MASTNISPTLDYLTDAAHLLRATAPETSAHLMSQRGQLMFHHDIAPSDIQRQHVCGACGNIMIPGNESTLKLETHKALGRRKQPRGRHQPTETLRPKDSAKVIRCGRCNRPTKVNLEIPPPAPRRKGGKSKKSALSTKTTESHEAPKFSANVTSKKRAKNRKAGLQALLAGQQQRSNPLSLADFMKK